MLLWASWYCAIAGAAHLWCNGTIHMQGDIDTPEHKEMSATTKKRNEINKNRIITIFRCWYDRLSHIKCSNAIFNRSDDKWFSICDSLCALSYSVEEAVNGVWPQAMCIYWCFIIYYSMNDCWCDVIFFLHKRKKERERERAIVMYSK